MKETILDYSRYFWQGKKVRLRPLHIEDADMVMKAKLITEMKHTQSQMAG